MKRFLSLLLVALLLCAPLSRAFAESGVDEFEVPAGNLFDQAYTAEQEHFTLTSAYGYKEDGFFCMSTPDRRDFPLSIRSKDGTIIDRVVFDVSYISLTARDHISEFVITHGTALLPQSSKDPFIIMDVNADSLEIHAPFVLDYTTFIQSPRVRVYYHKSVPATGDAAAPALWLILCFASAGAIVVLTARRRREF